MASFAAATTVSSASSSAAVISNTGVRLIGATGAPVYSLAAPYRGAIKTLVQTTTSSALKAVLVNSSDASTAVTIGGAATATTLTFTAIDQAVQLVGASATSWRIVSNVGSVDAS